MSPPNAAVRLLPRSVSAGRVSGTEGSEFRAHFRSDGSKVTGGAPWSVPCLHFSLLMIFKSLQMTQLTFLFTAMLPTPLPYS